MTTQKEIKVLPESVILSDGRTVTKRRAKVKDMAAAENQPKNKEHLARYAMFAAKIFIDSKPVVLEDILDLYEEDLEIISNLFIDEDEQKNV
jgi:hypothetical protein